MGKRKGIILKAYVQFTETHATEIGSNNDRGPAKFLKLKVGSFLVQQGFKNEFGTEFDVNFKVYGNDFKYINDIPYQGITTKIKVTIGEHGSPNPAETALVLSKLHIDAPQAAKIWLVGDPFEVFATLLAGDDKVMGSPFADHMFGGKGKDICWGWAGPDIVDGGPGKDINDGGAGNDYLIDTKGKDWFQFSTAIDPTNNLNFNYDKIKSFGIGDHIYLKESIFPGIGAELDADEFVNGPNAVDGNDFLLWNNKVASYDPDGNGPNAPIPIFTTENDATITHQSFIMGAMYDYGY